MDAQLAYLPAVMSRFMNPHHAGSLKGLANAVKVQAGSRESGASIQLWLQLLDNRVLNARFEAYGCPHFIAAAEMLCEWCEGRLVGELPQWNWQRAQSELAVPPAKRGRLLILGNALKSAIETLLSTQAPAG